MAAVLSPPDLEAYLARIGYAGPRAATAEVLTAVHVAHAATIPFENLDILLGRTIATGLPAIVRKLVHDRRGGYCFEQNALLGAALRALGFTVAPFLGRVRWQVPAEVATPLAVVLTELLQNAVEHGFPEGTPRRRSGHVDFTIRLEGGMLIVTIRDDGVGFAVDQPTAAEQDGLVNMRHRIAEIGGRVDVESAAGSGTSVTFHVPFDVRRRIGDDHTLEMAHDA